MLNPSLPPESLLESQAAWLAPARARVLRRVQITGRQRVLDLACGYGTVTGELRRRCRGMVVSLDRSYRAVHRAAETLQATCSVCADAAQMPFRDRSFDLVFCQFALLWLDVQAVVRQIHRVLEPAGVLVAMEPDYGGLIEYPPEIATRELWLSAIVRAGGDPIIGRKLPGVLSAAGFHVRADLLERLEPPSHHRFAFLRGLWLEAEEIRLLEQIESADESLGQGRAVHLPVFLITATKE